METRFNGNVVPFASNSSSGERTVFGDWNTESDDINDNLNADFIAGWENGLEGTLNPYPPSQYFNAALYTVSSLVAYLYQQGVAGWNTNQDHLKGSISVGSDGMAYVAKTGTTGTPNNGNNPTSDSVNWVQIATLSDNVASATKLKTARTISITGDATGNTTFDGSANKSISINVLDSEKLDGKSASSFNQVIGTDTDINTSGATIIDNINVTDGVITSMGTRILTPSDIGVVDYDSAHSFSLNGYQKLENGLILQWIKTPSTGDGGTTTVTFPISFTSSVFFIGTTKEGSANYTGSGDDRILSYTNSNFVFAHGTVAGTNFIFALGV